MNVTKKQLTDTSVRLAVSADDDQLQAIKTVVLERLRDRVKLQGFRSGKAPLSMVERSLDPNVLQSEFLEQAINDLYVAAAAAQKLRPVSQPSIELKKFVPFSTLEFTAEVSVVGAIKLPDYKKLKLAKPTASVAASDVTNVLDDLAQRTATKKEVKRAAKDGDEVIIDFAGTDTKTKDAISGASGQTYPLVLGSKTFIPGFEEHLVGLKAGEEKTFAITFPKDYGVTTLQSRKVTFAVTVQKVQAVTSPKLDDAFAGTLGPFKTLAELKADIKKQLQAEKDGEVERAYENDLVTKVSDGATVAIPDSLIEEEIDRLEQDERRNLTYRGQTWQEHLAAEGVSEDEHRERNREPAAARVKAGLVLSEIAEKEQVTVTAEEVDLRLQLLKGQYSDAKMQAELDKPANRRDIASRIMTEKTVAVLKQHLSK